MGGTPTEIGCRMFPSVPYPVIPQRRFLVRVFNTVLSLGSGPPGKGKENSIRGCIIRLCSVLDLFETSEEFHETFLNQSLSLCPLALSL